MARVALARLVAEASGRPAARQVRLPLVGLVEAARTRPRVLYFASGMNGVGEIRGFADIGHPVGANAPDCAPNCEKALASLAGRGVPVFLDNGAIAEKRTGKRIGDVQWDRRLALAERLAVALGPMLHVVAPDKVGDPAETERRWRRARPALDRIRARGAHVLVPLQSAGGITLGEMERRARAILGASFVPAVPARRRATPLDAIRVWLRESRPAAVHFLGVGPDSADGKAILRIVAEESPKTHVRMDSVRLRGGAGRSGGRGGGARRFTVAWDEAREELREYWWGSGPPGEQDAEGWGIPDYTDEIAFPSGWMDAKERVRFADEARLTGEDRARFLADPDEFVQSDYDSEEPGGISWGEWLDPYLDVAWARFRDKLDVHPRKRRAVVRTYGSGVDD